MPWEAGRAEWLPLQVSRIRDDGGMEEDCGNQYGKKKTGQRKIRKVELTRLDVGTSQTGGKEGRTKSNIIPRFLDLAI